MSLQEIIQPAARLQARTDPMKIFSSPALYIQGPGALERAGAVAAASGRRALMVSDTIVLELIGERMRRSVEAAGLAFHSVSFADDVTHANVDRMVAQAREFAPDVVFACGGGKGIDAGKAVGDILGARMISVPTAASSDAPTSRNYVFYSDTHALLSVEKLVRNPDAVLVDTAVIAQAPPRLLSSGIGDALVKRWEAEQCIASGGPNMHGASATIASSLLARLCADVLLADGPAALRVAGSGAPDSAFERVIEACLLLAGLGFEGSGLSIPHAMTRGLSAIPEAAAQLHGLQVAYALMVHFRLENRPEGFVAEMRDFYRAAGLPATLAELGVTTVDESAIGIIADLTLKAPHTLNFERSLSAADIAEAIRSVEASPP